MVVVNNDPTAIVSTAIAVVLFLSLGIFLMKWPEKFVSKLGRFLRGYATSSQLTDEQREKMVLPGTKTLYNDSMKDFMAEAEQHPEIFIKMVDYVRNFGMLIVAMIAGALFLILIVDIMAFLLPHVTVCYTSQPGCP